MWDEADIRILIRQEGLHTRADLPRLLHLNVEWYIPWTNVAAYTIADHIKQIEQSHTVHVVHPEDKAQQPDDTEKQIEKSHNVVHPEDKTVKQIKKSHNVVHPEDNNKGEQIEKSHTVVRTLKIRQRRNRSRSRTL